MAKDEDLRKCPECGDLTGHLMHVDKFPCKCGDKVCVEYAVCDCGMSWRAVDGKFIDGCVISVENVNELVEEVEEFFEDQGMFSGENPGDSMENLIHRCLKCGAIAAQAKENVYECTECDFSWEVDEFNG